MNTPIDYWKECISQAAEECDLTLTADQLEVIADAVYGGHENYGMAFYSPPAGDRATTVEREWKAKYAALETRLRDFEERADKAVRRLGKIPSDCVVTIDQHGYVEAR